MKPIIIACTLSLSSLNGVLNEEKPYLPRTIKIFTELASITNLPNGYHLKLGQGFVEIIDNEDVVIKTILIENLHGITVSQYKICFHCKEKTISYNYDWEKIEEIVS